MTLKSGETIRLPREFEVKLNPKGTGVYLTFCGDVRWIPEDASFDRAKDGIMQMLKSHFKTTDRIVAYLLSQ